MGEYVMVPRELTPEMREAFHDSYEAYEDGRGECPDSQWRAMLRVAPKPDEQHQGEPVAWLTKCKQSGLVEQAEPNEKASNPEHWTDAFPVYDSPKSARSQFDYDRGFAAGTAECETLRNLTAGYYERKLAERDALLRDVQRGMREYEQGCDQFPPFHHNQLMERIDTALSASAEPSAPIHTSDHRLMTSARELPDAERAKAQLMVSLLPSEESARILSKGAGRILTSDETVEKFYRQIVEASEVKPSAPEWDGKSWDVVYQREGKTVLSIRSDGVMDVYDRDGVKALMFDLINMEYGAIVEIDERAAFEAWAKEQGLSVSRTPQALCFYNGMRRATGDYIDLSSLCSYAAWQARAALERKP